MSDIIERRELHSNYEAEVRERYGNTSAYKEYKEKIKEYSDGKWDANNLSIMVIFSEFAECLKSGNDASSPDAQALVVKLQEHITAYYYTCTDEILAGLGQMYVADDRFQKNIDKYGKGTAQFASEAISIYCRAKGV